MFDLLRFVCEKIFGSSLFLSRECLDYLSKKLQMIFIELIQQSFSLALRSKRTRLLGDDLQIILKSHSISPLFGYCCASTTNRKAIFRTIRQDGRILFTQTDLPIDLTNINSSRNYPICSENILLHVEWLAIDGEQKDSPKKFSLSKYSILNQEQTLFLSSLIQSNNIDHQQIWNWISEDPIALNTILSPLIQWCRNDICECLQQSCRWEKRRQLTSCLIILDHLLQNSSKIIEHYLHVLTPIITNCLLYQFECKEPLEFDENSRIDSGHVWYIRLIASRACVKILQRSTSLLYDDFYIRIITRLVCALTDINSPLSTIYAILRLFEQLGHHVSRRFLLPHLLDIKLLSSKPLIKVLERLAAMFIETSQVV